MDEESRIKIFGSDKTGNNKTSNKGSAIFYDAHILYLPVQDEKNLFSYVTSNSVLEQMKTRLELFEIKNINPIQFKVAGNRQYNKSSWLKENFTSLCSDINLPIIARNELVNGVSKNLWYEQVVPAETVFYAVIQEPDDTLANAINNKFIQIGANATIGYGYCKFNLIYCNNGNEGKK